jgi:hypothetical protein
VRAAIRGSSPDVAVQTLDSSADTDRLVESTPRWHSQSDLDRFSI